MNKIIFTSKYIEVQCDRNDTATQEKMMSIYPLQVNRIKTLYRVSPRLVPEILQLLRSINESNISIAPQAVQNYYFNEIHSRMAVQELISNGPKESCIVSDKLTLDTHQQLGREIVKYRNKYAFFYDTRTGKTPMSLAIMNDDVALHPSHKWLVVCPLILIYNAWLEDSDKFFPCMNMVNCHAATPAKRVEAMQRRSNVYVTNTESFIKYRQYFDKMNFHGCFVDESSDMKSAKSQVSKELVDFANNLERFYLLSGTPAPNGEHEYYMQMRSVDYYAWHTSYSQYKEYYFVNLSYNQQYEKLHLRPDRKDEFYNKLRESSIYIDKADVLQLPGREFIPEEYEMPKELMKQYRKLKDELYLEVKEADLKILANGAGAKLNKLNQVSSGFIMDTKAAKENKLYDSNLTEWYLLDNWRFNELQKLLDRPTIKGEQVIIWANYRREFELIKNMLGDNCACVYGGASLQEKNDAISKFKQGTIQYLIANPASADKGLTLTNCHINIYFSLNWSYETFKQSYERIYGDIKRQPKFCRYYIMIAKGTIDSILYFDVLQGKSDSSYAVLNHLKPEGLKNEKTN